MEEPAVGIIDELGTNTAKQPKRPTIAPKASDAGNYESSRLNNNGRPMKHHEVFVACSNGRELVLETRDWVLMIGCETTELLRTC